MHSLNKLLTVTILITVALSISTCNLPTEPIYKESNGQIIVHGITLRFTIAVPSTYSPDKAAPLILALHYGNQSATYYGGEFLNILVKPALQELDAIMVAPTCPSSGGWTAATSEISVMALMDSIINNYTIDEQRIIVTGFSAGGIGTWFFAASYPDFFSAAIPVAGEPIVGAANTIGNMPLYVIHSRNDGVILYEDVASIISQLQSAGLDIKFITISDASHYNTSAYIGPLRGAIPWLHTKWGE